MTDKEELRRLAQAVTPGPWRAQHPFDGERGWEVAERTGLEQICAGLTPTRAAFIAAANPPTVIELLDEIERLRNVFEAARRVLKHKGSYQPMTVLHKAVQAVMFAEQGDE